MKPEQLSKMQEYKDQIAAAEHGQEELKRQNLAELALLENYNPKEHFEALWSALHESATSIAVHDNLQNFKQFETERRVFRDYSGSRKNYFVSFVLKEDKVTYSTPVREIYALWHSDNEGHFDFTREFTEKIGDYSLDGLSSLNEFDLPKLLSLVAVEDSFRVWDSKIGDRHDQLERIQ